MWSIDFDISHGLIPEARWDGFEGLSRFDCLVTFPGIDAFDGFAGLPSTVWLS